MMQEWLSPRLRQTIWTLFFLWFFIPATGHAEGVLDSLLGDGNLSVSSETNGYMLPETARARLKQVELLLKNARSKKSRQALSLQLKKLNEKTLRYQMPLKKWYLRRDLQIQKQRQEIVKQLKQMSDIILREQNAHTSLRQSYINLIQALKLYLKARKNLSGTLKKSFDEKKRNQLFQLMKRLQVNLNKHREKRRKASLLLKKINRSLALNEKRLEKTRKQLFLPPPPPRTATPPRPAVRPPAKRTRRSRRSRRSRRRKASSPPAPRPLTAAQRKKQERQQEIQLLKEQQDSFYRRLLFDIARHQEALLTLRQQDERLHLEHSQVYIHLYRYSHEQMKAVYVLLKAKAEGGLLHLNSFDFNAALLDQIHHHALFIMKRTPKAVQQFGQDLRSYVGKFTKHYGFLSWIMLIFLPLFLLITGLGLRLVLRQVMRWCSLKQETSPETARFWTVAQATTEITRDLVWYGLLLLGLFVAFRLVAVPKSWSAVAFSFAWILLIVRTAWTLANRLFAVEPEQRLVQLEEFTVHRLRRVLKGQSLFALVYLPIYQAATLLKFPPELGEWMWLGWLFSLLLSILLLAFRKKSKQEEEEEADAASVSLQDEVHPFQRWWGRLFPLFAILGLVLFLVYGWGYQNLATYLFKSFLLTLLVLSGGSAIFAFFLGVTNWLIGDRQKEGKLKLTPRIASYARRLSKIVVSLLSGFAVLSLLLAVWEVPGGIKLLYKLLNTPILNVQKTRLSVLSLVRFMAVFGFSIWFSGWIKEKLSQHLYPALRLDNGTQHAINTMLGYLILALGGLLGLRVMGMSVGVLAVFAGVIGIGVGFGMQNIANNFISGLIITFGRPIAVGHIIEVGDTTGVVQKISARSTTLETFDSRIILIPNSQIISNQVINWSLGPPYVVALVTVGVAYGSDTRQVKQALVEIAHTHPGVLKKPAPNVRFSNFGDNTLDFELRVGISDLRAKFNLLSDLRFTINERFAELGIEISFPQQDVHLNPDMEEAITQLAQNLKR